MRPSRLYRVEAIVLRDRKIGEADKIVTLYTPDHGRFDAIAKGVRRPTSRKRGHLELLSRTSLLIARGRSLDVITQSQALDSFAPLRDDLDRLSRGLYVVDLVYQFTVEQQANPELYGLAAETLLSLASRDSLDLTLRRFELDLLEFTGYRPELRSCVSCGAALAAVINYFSPPSGGAVCPACRASETVLRPLSVNALKVMRLLQASAPAVATRLQMSNALSAEIEEHLHLYIRYLLEREPRSRQFMRSLLGPTGYRVLS